MPSVQLSEALRAVFGSGLGSGSEAGRRDWRLGSFQRRSAGRAERNPAGMSNWRSMTEQLWVVR